MRAKLISELKPGDVFIWGNQDTRSNMCVRGEHLGALVCDRVEPDPVPTECKIYFILPSGKRDSRFYERSDIAILAAGDLSNLVHHDVICKQCDMRYGKHAGVRCQDGQGEYFVPRQDDLECFHSEELRKAISGCDDFFDSIGL
jgi:hypothetical protein